MRVCVDGKLGKDCLYTISLKIGQLPLLSSLSLTCSFWTPENQSWDFEMRSVEVRCITITKRVSWYMDMRVVCGVRSPVSAILSELIVRCLLNVGKRAFSSVHGDSIKERRSGWGTGVRNECLSYFDIELIRSIRPWGYGRGLSIRWCRSVYVALDTAPQRVTESSGL